jgi:hypothetical protein
MSWSAFKSKNMFDRRWILRRERFIIYQLAMLICLAAECTATYSLSKYEDLQTHVETVARNEKFRNSPAFPNPNVHLHNNNLVDAEIVTIVFCVMVATLYGADFFFLLMFPARRYPKWYNVTKLFLAVVITLGVLVAAIVSTWVVATGQATITGVDQAAQNQLTELYFRPPLVYRHWSVNIAYVVVLWLGFLATLARLVILSLNK